MAKGSGKGSVATKTCNNCGALGHIAGQCTKPPQCHCCGSTKHQLSDCPNRDKTCSICGKVGHLKVKCRQAAYQMEKDAKAEGKTCNNCGWAGHLARDCKEA